MEMLGLNEALDQLSKSYSVYLCRHVLRLEGGHALCKLLDFKVEGHRR